MSGSRSARSTILFTRHAVERYLDFHVVGSNMPTFEDARELLERHADQAVKTGERTRRGDDIWEIASLGIEVVTKPEHYGDVCVTVLPPRRMRGLTPVQAERLQLIQDALSAQQVALATQVGEAAGMPADDVALLPTMRGNQAAHLAQTAARAARAGEMRDQARVRLVELQTELALVVAQRDVIVPIMKTWRHQTTVDAAGAKRALRVAIRFLLAAPEQDRDAVLAKIAAIEPRFLAPSFLDHDGLPDP